MLAHGAPAVTHAKERARRREGPSDERRVIGMSCDPGIGLARQRSVDAIGELYGLIAGKGHVPWKCSPVPPKTRRTFGDSGMATASATSTPACCVGQT